MSYFFNFMRIWALSLFSTLGPLAPPNVQVDTVAADWCAIGLNRPAGTVWDAIDVQIRKDPVGAFVPIDTIPTYGAFLMSYICYPLSHDTTYWIQFRSRDRSTGRFSNWVEIRIHTLP